MRVVVVGGGVVGCAVARALAADHSVLVLERTAVGAGASGRAAGLVTVGPAYAHRPAVATHAVEAFEAFDCTRGVDYRPAPSLEHPSERGPVAERARELADAGCATTHLDAATARERHPALRVPDAGFLRYERTGWVDPAALTEALAATAVDRGARVETGVEVTGVATADGRVDGVETDGGRYDADAVVVAAGWRTPEVVDAALPVRPYRTQCVVVEADVDPDLPMGWLPDRDVYWRPTREGNLLVGGGSAATDEPTDAPRAADPAFRDRARDAGGAILADAAAPRVVDHWAGVDAATPDTYPIVDAVGPDVVAATGFHGRGIMSAFTAGVAVRGRLVDDAPVPLEPFSLDRFDDRSADFPFVSVSA